MTVSSIDAGAHRSPAPPDIILTALHRLQDWLNRGLGDREWYALLFLLGAGWLALRPYLLTHDGLLYAFQALAELNSALTNDPSLIHFNQGDLSLFTPLYSLVVAELGLWPAAWLIYVPCQVLYFFALAALCNALLPSRRLALLALTTFTVTSGLYPPGTFRFAESWLTARLPAEALVLSGLWLALQRRYVTASLCGLAAMAMHPLMAMPGWGLAFWWWLRSQYGLPFALTLTVATASTCALVLALLLPPMSPTLQEILGAGGRGRLFVSYWRADQWLILLTYALLLGIGLRSQTVRLRRLSEGLLILLVLAIGFSLLADALSAQWLLAVQPRRLLWLVAAGIIPIAVDAVGRPLGQPAQLAGQTALLNGVRFTAINAYFPAPLLLALLAPYLPDTARWQATWKYLTVFFTLLLLFSLLSDPLLGWRVAQQIQASAPPMVNPYGEILCEVRGYFLPLAVLGLFALLTLEHRIKSVCLALGSATLGLTLASFIAVTPTPTAAERTVLLELRARIAPTEQVFWHNGLHQVWFELQRPSYASLSQLSPSVYSEALAQDVHDRLIRLVQAGLQPAQESNAGSELITPPTRPDLAYACADSRLSWIVLPAAFELAVPGAVYRFVFHTEAMALIDCEAIRTTPSGLNRP